MNNWQNESVKIRTLVITQLMKKKEKIKENRCK